MLPGLLCVVLFAAGTTLDLTAILDLLNNPFVAALIGTFLGPILAGFPGFSAILKFMANIAGYDLVPKPKPAAKVPTLMTMEDGTKVIIPPSQGLLDNLDLSKILPFLMIGGFLFLMITSGGGCPKPTPTPTPSPVPAKVEPFSNHITPPADLQVMVTPVKNLAATKPDVAIILSSYWEAGADMIRRDSSVLKTTGQVLKAKVDADALYLQHTTLVGSLPGLSSLTDSVISQSVGLDDKPLDDATRKRLADTFDAIAWALGA